MASHGVPRPATREQRSVEAREKEAKDISEYRSLVDFVNQKVGEQDFSPELLQKTAALLRKNPEYYTIWNVRRRIYNNEFDVILKDVEDGKLSEDNRNSQILDIVKLDLQFLFPLLLKFPKCYWIWNHRIWLLEQSSLLLPSAVARSIWEDELGLVSKMLTRDSRNYHGWAYRRFIVDNLESADLNGNSMARSEYAYTTKMIGNNLSNFSAWHNRTKLISRILKEEDASPTERQIMLEEEIKLIHKALFDPYDQSLWFYHQNLMTAFDPDRASKSMAPDLSKEDRLKRVDEEQDFIRELLEDVDDCKWAYQALIDCRITEGKLEGALSAQARADIHTWLGKLKELDPLRTGRWEDMETQLK